MRSAGNTRCAFVGGLLLQAVQAIVSKRYESRHNFRDEVLAAYAAQHLDGGRGFFGNLRHVLFTTSGCER
jgi:hypothetical protein